MKLDGVTVELGRCPVLHDINVQALPSRITAVLGPNAAGKTTLLRTIAGLVRPVAGCVTHDGVNVTTMSPRDRARQIGLVPQRFRGDVPFTVIEIIALGARQRRSHVVDEAIESCNLQQLSHRPFVELSVGQQQRVVIARALAQVESPGVLILDEPLAALDLRFASAMLELLRERARAGDTVIMSLHDLGVASSSCDDAWLLGEGKLVGAGDPADVLAAEQLEAVYGARFERLQRRDGRDWIVPAGA